jgi:hypothetical protein
VKLQDAWCYDRGERTEEQPIDCPSLQLYVKKTDALYLALLDFALLHNTGYCAGFL